MRLKKLFYLSLILQSGAALSGENLSIAFHPPPMTVPPGFEVELAAGPPLVKHPMMAGLDPRGRLFISESDGINREDEQVLETEKPHKILMLEDLDGDGRFDKSSVFADKMTLPNGGLWYDGALYVASPPGIWRLADRDDDGVCDDRTLVMEKFGFDGNSCSFHGPFLSPDGRLYLAGGQHGYEIEANGHGQPPTISDAAGVFSCLPDGSDRSIHLVGGMDNPVEVDFTPEGELVGTVNLFHGNPRADCLMHWLWGGVYPKRSRENRLAQFKRTGSLMPYTVNMGHVAVSGLRRYRGDALGDEYEDDLFIAEFNTHKVVRLQLEESGSTFRSKVEDFMVSPSNDVHFTDVIEDADGSLLVIDTGGWYRHGCPTSQVAKPEILGAIYRIRKSGSPRIEDPRGESIDWEKLTTEEIVGLLDDDRFVVRDRALEASSRRGEEGVEPLKESLQSESRRLRLQSVWALARIRSEGSRASLRDALSHSDPSVVQAAQNAIAMAPDKKASEDLIRIFETGAPPLRRCAAAALGRIGAIGAVPPLLAGLQATVDRELEHSILYALIEIDEPEPARKGLSHESLVVQRGALIALDQMDSGDLEPSEVIPYLSAADAPLREAALSIVAKREGWGDQIIGSFEDWLSGENEEASRETTIRGALSAFMENEAVQNIAAAYLGTNETSSETKAALLGTLADFPYGATPEIWADSLQSCLQDQVAEPVQIEACRAIDALNIDGFDDRLLEMGAHCCLPITVRLAAWEAVVERATEVDAQSFVLLSSQLHEKVPTLDRIRGAKILSKAPLDSGQLIELADWLPQSGPLALARLLTAYETSSDRAVGESLVRALEQAGTPPGLQGEELSRLVSGYPPEVSDRLLDLLAKEEEDAQGQIERIRNLVPLVADRGPEAGQRVFYSQKAACSVCHRIENLGGRIGPDLTHIGQIRSATDLLESILYPSASIAQGFEPFTVFTTGGEVHNGVLAHEAAEWVTLADASGAGTRIPRPEIEEIRTGELSIMPEGLDAALDATELAELVGFLLSRN
jgi:putative membrane-bound dehydrogenase-like protein